MQLGLQLVQSQTQATLLELKRTQELLLECVQIELMRLTKFSIFKYGGKFKTLIFNNDYEELLNVAQQYYIKWIRAKGTLSTFICDQLMKRIFALCRWYFRRSKLNNINAATPSSIKKNNFEKNRNQICDLIDEANLNSREKLIMQETIDGLTLKEIEVKYNRQITFQRIQQIRDEALVKLQLVAKRN